MTFITRLSTSIKRALLLAPVVALAACSLVLGFEEPQSEEACILNSDCSPGKVRIFRACSAQCAGCGNGHSARRGWRGDPIDDGEVACAPRFRRGALGSGFVRQRFGTRGIDDRAIVHP